MKRSNGTSDWGSSPYRTNDSFACSLSPLCLKTDLPSTEGSEWNPSLAFLPAKRKEGGKKVGKEGEKEGIREGEG